MSFTLIWQKLLDSTVWMLSKESRLVWITILLSKNKEGVVISSIPGLAHRARVSVEECERALGELLAPDSYSSTPDNEGRRIERIQGGWKVLNHDLYRMSEEWRTEQARLRKAKERAKTAASEPTPALKKTKKAPNPTKAQIAEKIESLKGRTMTTKELSDELKKLHGSYEDDDSEEIRQDRRDRVAAKIAKEEAEEAAIRKKFNPDFDTSKAAEKITLSNGQSAATWIKGNVDDDPLTKEDLVAVRAIENEDSGSGL